MPAHDEPEHKLLVRWLASRPKRLLALDGGGVRGVVTLAFLKRMETLLREEHGADATLARHFDLIGGTSTGAIIAAALASGRSVDWIIEKYHALAAEVFAVDDSGWLGRFRSKLGGILSPKFDSAALERHLDGFFDFPLGSERLETGLVIMIRRADTASAWPVHNNPRGRYYAGPEPGSGSDWIANKDLSVARLVRASTAAPSYFEPQRLVVGRRRGGEEETGLFVDGGVSPHNNPALQMLRVATLGGYGFGWPLGERELELTSVGTGASKVLTRGHGVEAKFAIECLKGLMDDCADEVEIMLQWMSRSPTARRIDGEIGDLDGDVMGPGPPGAREPLLRYLRYDMSLDESWITTRLGVDVARAEVEALRQMDRPASLERLTELATRAAALLVRPEHVRSVAPADRPR